jgi:predicted N-acetyltransferase YhbS
VMRELGHPRIDCLKMDIKGSEYDVIRDIVRSGIPIGQVAVEFHHRIHRLGADRTREALRLLRRAGFAVFFVSDDGAVVSLIQANASAHSRLSLSAANGSGASEHV